jgi:sulfoxide reductase heme-binding subunit YedZ
MALKNVFFWILVGIVLLAAYEALFPLPALAVMTRFFGLAGFFLLCFSLMAGPLALLKPASFASWIKARRTMGVAAFVFLIAHFLLSLLNNFNLNFFRAFHTFGYLIAVPALVIIAVLGITSADAIIRKVGFPGWKTIQRLVYIAFALSIIHFYYSANGLFISIGQKIFVNLAEIALFALAAITIALQITCFFAMRMKRKRG